MSKPQSEKLKRLKRPRGLLASRKSGTNSAELEPASKKARADDDSVAQDPEELKLQDWHDLNELFENALDALYGTNWTSALPLVRGVLHECARLVSVHKDPTFIYAPLGGDIDPTLANTPASAFYTIFASAWLLMATFARNEESLLAPDEPEDPLEYILSALAACERGQQALDARKKPKSWQLELTWGRALILAAQQLVESSQDDAGQTQSDSIYSKYIGPDPPTTLDRASEHLSYAIQHRVVGVPEEERATSEERFARILLETGQNSLSAVEGLEASDDEESSRKAEQIVRHFENAYNLFVKVEELAGIPFELCTQAALGAARASLSIGSTWAELLEVEEDGTNEREQENSSSLAIRALREAIERLDRVYNAGKRKSAQASGLLEAEDVKPLLQEALITLATLLPKGSEQDAMYARYQEAGGILDDEGEDNSDEE